MVVQDIDALATAQHIEVDAEDKVVGQAGKERLQPSEHGGRVAHVVAVGLQRSLGFGKILLVFLSGQTSYLSADVDSLFFHIKIISVDSLNRQKRLLHYA